MNLQRRRLLAAGAAFPLLRTGKSFAQGARIEAMTFSALKAGGPLPDSLKPWNFDAKRRATQYSLVSDEGTVVLRAQAQASTSGIVRELRLDPRAHPILEWRWKVQNLVARGDLATREGDDFPARVYVTFEVDPGTLTTGERMQLGLARMIYGDRVPDAALCYVWDGKAPPGTFAPNAYTDRVRMVVAQSGAAQVGRWVSESRDLRSDYKRAFGTDPGAVTGVIVSTDTDNTGETATAFYGDISFGPP